MLTIVLLFLFAFGLSLAFAFICRKAALKLGLVDQPDTVRKVHPYPVPRLGGIAVLAGMGAAAALITAFGGTHARADLDLVIALGPALLIIAATGLLDDLAGLTPRKKLIGQTAAAVAACCAGVYIGSPAVGGVWWQIPLSIAWLVGCSNALNLIDGMDGLATGVGLLVSAAIVVAGLSCGDARLAIVAVLTAGALSGFLPLNLSPASIFLGDSGSLSLGFLLGCLGVVWANHMDTLPGLAAPAMALCVPLFDTVTAIARRFLRGQPIFSSDRGHVHHRLLARGISTRKSVLALYVATIVGSSLGLLETVVPANFKGVVLTVFVAGVWLAIRFLGFDEFAVAIALVRHIDFRAGVRARLRLRTLEAELGRCTRTDECWRALQEAAREFGFSDIALHLRGHTRFAALSECNGPRWHLEVGLGAADTLSVGYGGAASRHRDLLFEFVESARVSLSRQLEPAPRPVRREEAQAAVQKRQAVRIAAGHV